MGLDVTMNKHFASVAKGDTNKSFGSSIPCIVSINQSPLKKGTSD